MSVSEYRSSLFNTINSSYLNEIDKMVDVFELEILRKSTTKDNSFKKQSCFILRLYFLTHLVHSVHRCMPIQLIRPHTRHLRMLVNTCIHHQHRSVFVCYDAFDVFSLQPYNKGDHRHHKHLFLNLLQLKR